MAESGFFAGIIIYFSLWYCKKEQTMRFGIVVAGATASGALDGILVRARGPHKKYAIWS